MDFVMFIIGLFTLMYLGYIWYTTDVQKAYDEGFKDGVEFQELINDYNNASDVEVEDLEL